jgi:hypothetical protein
MNEFLVIYHSFFQHSSRILSNLTDKEPGRILASHDKPAARPSWFNSISKSHASFDSAAFQKAFPFIFLYIFPWFVYPMMKKSRNDGDGGSDSDSGGGGMIPGCGCGLGRNAAD